MKNPAGYFEIPVTNLKRSVEFYSYVFGYNFEFIEIHGNKMALFPLSDKADGISGGLAQGEIYIPSKTGSLIYLNTNNIDECLKKVLEKNGTVLFPKTSAGEFGMVAEFEDCEGNRIALQEIR